MNPSDPGSWRCPAEWSTDFDGDWQFEALRELGQRLLASSADLAVELNPSDPSAVFVDVRRGGAKLGEAYVNRSAPKAEEAVYSVYVGSAEREPHTTSLDLAVAHLEHGVGVWPSDS